MDSGMTARLPPERGSALEQATEADAAGAGTSGSGWSRVRATGFARGVPAPLVDAIRASASPDVRIETGLQVATSVAPRRADLHLVAIGGMDEPTDNGVNGLGCLAGTTGPKLAVCVGRDGAMTMRALAAGADGVLYLHDGRDDLARALRAAASGAPALTATAARALIGQARAAATHPAPMGAIAQDADEPTAAACPHAVRHASSAVRLSAREREIIMLADQGCTFTQAARLMGVQVSTVYTHVRRLYDKLSVNSLPQALHEARRAGLL